MISGRNSNNIAV